MTVYISPSPRTWFGPAFAGYKLFNYAAGTLTKQNTFTDSTGATPNSNPIILDANGSASVFYTSGLLYKSVLALPTDTDPPSAAIWSSDNLAVADASGAIFTPAFSGAVSTTVAAWLNSDHVDIVAGFGADPTGVADSTTAINNAIATGRPTYIPPGTYKVSAAITCATNGQHIFGHGRTVSIIKAAASFNLSASGVFVATCGEPGPVFENFEVTCDQSAVATTGTRTGLIAYPPAFFLRATPRFELKNIRITQFPFGVDMQANSGGSLIDFLENGCYTCGIVIDGSLDTVRINNHHYYNYDQTTNQLAIWNDGGNTAISIGRMDDLKISNCLNVNAGKSINIFVGAGTALSGTPAGSGWSTGPAFGEINNYDFDTYGGLFITGGSITVAPHVLTLGQCFFTMGSVGVQAAVIKESCFVKMSGCEFETSAALTSPMVQVSASNASNQAEVIISDSIFRATGDMISAQVSASAGSATLTISNCDLNSPVNASPTNPIVKQLAGGLLAFTGNRFSGKGTGTGNGLSIATDDQHFVSSNSFNGWGFTFPSVTNASYGPNSYPGANSRFDSPLLSSSSGQFNGGFGCNGSTPQPALSGWGTPTGASVINNYPGASATLVQTSNAVAEIILQLKNIGFFST